MPTNDSRLHRRDPIFQRRTPLLFAHRGGAGEAPESTEEAFRHAVEQGADVLELDVRLTRDGRIVVWHGPRLENVRGRGCWRADGRRIGDFDWRELRDRVWVVHPTNEPEFAPIPERRLLLLGDFLKLVEELQEGTRRTLHLNIELKAASGEAPDWKNEHFDKLLELVDEASEHRTIILASAGHRRLKALQRRIESRGRKHPTNLSWLELLDHRFNEGSLANVAYETSHAWATRSLVTKVRRAGGSFYVFLTGIRIVAPAIDHMSAEDLEGPLFSLLDMGVDGIMTDYPRKVGALIRKWKRNAR